GGVRPVVGEELEILGLAPAGRLEPERQRRVPACPLGHRERSVGHLAYDLRPERPRVTVDDEQLVGNEVFERGRGGTVVRRRQGVEGRGKLPDLTAGGHAEAAAVALQHAGLVEQRDELLEEERVAAAPVEQQLAHLRRRLATEQQLEQPTRRGARERVEVDNDEVVTARPRG